MSIKKRPDGKYRARFRDAAGKEHSRHFDKRGDALRWEAEQRANVGQGRLTTVSDITFRVYAEQWRGVQPHRPGTQRNYEYTLRLHIYPHIGDLRLPLVRRSDVQALLTDLGKSHAPKTVHNVYRLIAAIMNSAVHDDLILQSPVRRLSLPAASERPAQPIPAEAVLDIANRVSARYRALVLLAGGTGLRLGECLGLTKERVDFLRREIVVEAQLITLPNIEPYLGPPKTESSRRRVAASDFVLEALAQHMEQFPLGPWDLVFTNRVGRHVNRQSWHRLWVTAVQQAGLPRGTTFHQLRHTHASMLIEGGASITHVARRLGHKNPSETLRTYSHLMPDADDQARRMIQALFSEHLPHGLSEVEDSPRVSR